MVDTDDNFVTFGTSLDPIEEEEVARKKPITIAEQIATDEQGRRRFHGAFTGGFSAGYYNTVGSKEGWTPSTFKSSRSERFSATDNNKGQNVTDFMDDEDLGAFGIAPQVLRPTEDFSLSEAQKNERKRAKPKQSDGPIPGVPVLHHIIEPVKETVGIKILVKMGWRPGQGVGPRVSKKPGKSKDKDKKKKEEEGDDMDKPTIVEDIDMDSVVTQKVYGCQLPSGFQKQVDDDDSSSSDVDTDILYAPDDVESPLCNPKENTFGLGYKGLERLSGPTGHVDLFGKQLKFGKVDNKNKNKQLNVTGEAFGIGAFEEPDEDVYNREDMSSYDFELETMEERRVRKAKEVLEKSKKKHKDSCIEGFHFAKSTKNKKKYFPPPTIPHDFQPVHRQRKSRFETPAAKPEDATSKRGLGRHALTVQERQVLLGEEQAPRSTDGSIVDGSTENKAPAQQEASIHERVERIKKFVQVLQAHSNPPTTTTAKEATVSQPGFQPFMKNPEKQERYDKYLTLVSAGFQDCLKDIQPPEMTEWEREREKQEFERAGAIYKPLSGVMSSRFVSAKSHDISHIVPEKEIVKEKDPSEDPKVAARLNLFGKLTHSVVEWHPDKVLCKRFNMKDPFPDSKFVGLRGVNPSLKSSASSTATPIETETPAVPPPSTPKKSLFDNLDFSKPPPGLFPVSNAKSSEAEPPPIGGEGESSANSVVVQTKKLEFQSNLSAELLDDKENVPVKAPLDLFKQIFADSSESESEEDDKNQKAPPAPAPFSHEKANDDKNNGDGRSSKDSDGKKNVQEGDRDRDRRKSGNADRDRKILYEKRYTRDDNARRESRSTRDEDRDKPRRSRGIFDKIDLTQLNQTKDMADNDRRRSERDEKKAEKVEEDDDDLLYGPKAPIKPPPPSTSQHSSNASTSNSNLQFQLQRPSTLSAYKTSSSLLLPKNSTPAEEQVVWVEKEIVGRSKSKKHSSIKKSKKSKSKKSKEKHKKNKKHKSKKSKHKTLSGHLGDSSSSEEHSDDSSSSVEIHGSLNQMALLAQLKHITRPH